MVYKPHYYYYYYFPFEIFWCTEFKFVLILKIVFFKYKLHISQILNFSQYLLNCLKIYCNDLKFF